jgi:hypothetical protein
MIFGDGLMVKTTNMSSLGALMAPPSLMSLTHPTLSFLVGFQLKLFLPVGEI